MLCCWKILLQRDCWWEKSDDNEEKQEVSSTEVEAETPVIVTVTDHTIDRVASSIDPDGATDEEDEAGSDHRNNVDSDTANPNQEAVEEVTVEEIVTRKLTREIQQESRGTRG